MKAKPPVDAPADDLAPCDSPKAALERLKELYAEAIAEVEKRFTEYGQGKLKPNGGEAPTYPYLCAEVPAEKASQTSSLALGRIAATSLHGASITHPELFEPYLLDQLRRIIERYSARLFVGRSRTPIPIVFALEQATAQLSPDQRAGLQYHFHTPNLIATNDDIVDGKIILMTTHKGLYRSEDSGESWALKEGNLPIHLEAGPLAIDPHDANTYYAGYALTPYGETWRRAAEVRQARETSNTLPIWLGALLLLPVLLSLRWCWKSARAERK